MYAFLWFSSPGYLSGLFTIFLKMPPGLVLVLAEDKERLPTFHWLPKLHKQPYKPRFIANSSSCTTTELSKLLTSYLTTLKTHVIQYCEKVYKRSGKNLFGQSKINVMY